MVISANWFKGMVDYFTCFSYSSIPNIIAKNKAQLNHPEKNELLNDIPITIMAIPPIKYFFIDVHF